MTNWLATDYLTLWLTIWPPDWPIDPLNDQLTLWLNNWPRDWQFDPLTDQSTPDWPTNPLTDYLTPTDHRLTNGPLRDPRLTYWLSTNLMSLHWKFFSRWPSSTMMNFHSRFCMYFLSFITISYDVTTTGKQLMFLWIPRCSFLIFFLRSSRSCFVPWYSITGICGMEEKKIHLN